VLKDLLPFWTTPHSIALREAADAGDIGCAQLLLGVCDAKYDNSVALRMACLNDDAEMFNLLLPVSDVNAAWDVLTKLNLANVSKNQCLDRLQAIVQRQTIEENIPSTAHAVQRKM
jgi:hypothetical protein